MTDENPHKTHDHGAGPFDEAFWERMYRARSAVWSGSPNAVLLEEASELTPGRALDVGCGEGADALWLAQRGWRVTAVDVSPTALERGARRAAEVDAEAARSIEWIHVDLTRWEPPEAAYDLVSSMFFHLPKDSREPIFRRLAAAVAPGGSLLVVGHHPSDHGTTARRPPLPELFYTAEEVAALLAPHGWDVALSEARARGAKDPEGRVITIHDAILRAVRRAR